MCNRILTSILIFSLLIGTIKVVRVTAQNGSTIYNGNEYELITNDLTWFFAKEDCEIRGGHLVTIANSEENEFVASLVESGIAIIGISDMETEGEWEWVSNEPVTYNNWPPGEPQDAGQEDYAGILNDGTWIDLQVWERMPYICEWDFVVSENNDDLSSLIFLFERVLILVAIVITLIFMKRKAK
ncbi:MAG: lectin-like protein [Candidatus Kariarchaeaceae archaeon]|jgi:hypothetical protein